MAYDDEHIIEFNKVSKQILEIDPHLKICVGTNKPDSIQQEVYKIIHITEEFNYNLKRIPIKDSLNEFDTILYLDTDIIIKKSIDFSILNGLSDGIYPFMVGRINNYHIGFSDILKSMIKSPLKSVSEHGFIIKRGVNTESFICDWERIDLNTRDIQYRHKGLPGAEEGLIIWTCAILNNITIHDTECIKDLTNKIIHTNGINIKKDISLI